MPYQVTDLYCPRVCIQLGKKKFNLSKLSLAVECKIIKQYGDLPRMMKSLGDNVDNIFEVLSLFMEDDIEKFKSAFLSAVIKDETATTYVMNKFFENIQNARPTSDIAKRNTSREGEKPDYARYYDVLAKRYGYSLEQYYDLTLKQLQILLAVAGESTYEEFQLEAQLHGYKLKDSNKTLSMTQKEDEEMDKLALSTLQRLQNEYKAKHG